MNQEVVEPGRRNGITERLQRHTVVASRQLQFLETYAQIPTIHWELQSSYPRHAHFRSFCPDRVARGRRRVCRTRGSPLPTCAVRTSSWSWPTTSPGISSSTCRTFARCRPRARRSRASSSPTRCAAPRARRSSPGSTRTTRESSPTAGSDGGFFAFHNYGLESETFATRLHSVGLHDRSHGQVPERLHPHPLGRRTGAVHPAGLGRMGRRRQGLRRLRLRPERERALPLLRRQHRGLPHRRRGGQGGSPRQPGHDRQEAVLPRDRPVRAAQPVHARAATRDVVPRGEGPSHARLQRGGHARQAELAEEAQGAPRSSRSRRSTRISACASRPCRRSTR